MNNVLVPIVTVGMVLALTSPAGAVEEPTSPVVGEQVPLDGGPEALPTTDSVDLGQVPVVDEDGLVLASSMDDYGAGVGVDPSNSSATEPSTSKAAPRPASAQGVGPCNPHTYADNPHVTRGQVSAHGWWREGTCDGATKATVRVCLLEWWVDSNGNRKWVNKGCSSKSIKQAGKSRKPAVNKRRTCTSFSTTGWANLVDVDVAGKWDNTEDGYKAANIGCRVNP